MTRYKVNLVHFVDAEDADAAIEQARDGREPVIGEAFVWGSSAIPTAAESTPLAATRPLPPEAVTHG